MDEPLDPELLLANAGWLRALARELAGPARAEDLVQETWLAALRRPSPALRNLPAWLSGVVRHLASREQRAEQHRADREARRARLDRVRSEAAQDAGELVAEAEIQRRLIECVMALAEPYRSTVLRRYFRGESPAEIARAEGLPPATVRTHLHRALAELRSELDRRSGGRDAWSAVALSLTGALRPAGIGGIGRVFAMSIQAKLGVLAVAACVLTGVVFWQGRALEGESGAVPKASSASAGADAALRSAPEELRAPLEDETAETSGTRESVPVAAPVPADLALAYGSIGSGRDDVEEAWVKLTDEAGLELGARMTDPGSWTIDGLHPGRWTLRAGARDRRSIEDELVLPVGDLTVRHDIVLESGLLIRIRVLDEHGEALVPGNGKLGIGLVLAPAALTSSELCLTNYGDPFGAGRFTFPSSDSKDRVPEGCYALLRLTGPLPAFVGATLKETVLETKAVTAPVEELIFHVDTRDIEERLGGLHARFVDATSGRPMASGRAQLLGLSPAVSASPGTPIDDRGEILFERKPPGIYWLGFRDENFVRSALAVRVPQGAVVDLGDVRVWPTATLRGDIVDEDGAPTGAEYRWAVLEEIRGPLDTESMIMHTGSHFEFKGVARAPLWIVLRAKDGTVMGFVVDASRGDVDGIVLQMRKGVTLTFAHGHENDGRLLTVADESGRPLTTRPLDTHELRARLAPGRYQLWTSVAEHIEQRQELVVGNEPLDVVVPAPER